jgi:hypothetical protein
VKKSGPRPGAATWAGAAPGLRIGLSPVRLKRMQSQVYLVTIVPIGAAPTVCGRRASAAKKRPQRGLQAGAAIPTRTVIGGKGVRG